MEDSKKLIQFLVDTSRKKYSLLNQLLEITKLQGVDINSNSLNSLLDHIKQKQEIMNEIDKMDRQFYNSFVELKKILNIKSLEDINSIEFSEVYELKSMVSTVMNKLSEIEQLDQKNIKGLSSEIETLKEEMKQFKVQTKVAKSYGGPNSNPYGKNNQGFYIDGKK
ncbi:hypothetical protein J2Z35_001570 [Acetoanaerobium pronyense]|uniref:FlgN protein n=1 Tax=Acetoanaerobium pronyense TaxID=1482736 RepID=A0ABS4KJ24_9FIRM|nr:flagellar export chaperone FlgN [Acetoanaerobium pronyense]MBP2027772.1 hypothetical protein [Acetoanaerobium pronyense]